MIDRLIDCGGGGGGSGDYGKMLDWFESQSERVAKLEAERDEWKHRAEALERALQEFAPCETCIKCPGHSCSCSKFCQCVIVSDWQFNAARFAAEATDDEPKI